MVPVAPRPSLRLQIRSARTPPRDSHAQRRSVGAGPPQAATTTRRLVPRPAPRHRHLPAGRTDSSGPWLWILRAWARISWGTSPYYTPMVLPFPFLDDFSIVT